MQFLADILAAPVDRPAVMETTALGAAYLAGYAAGLCPDLAGFARDLEMRAALRAADGRGDPRAQMGGLARCGRPHPDGALSGRFANGYRFDFAIVFDARVRS